MILCLAVRLGFLAPNICTYYTCTYYAPKNQWKNKGVGHLKTRLFTIKTSKHVG